MLVLGTFHQYYTDVDNLVADVENDFIEGYKSSLKSDRYLIDEINKDLPIKQKLQKALSSVNSTIVYCFDHKRKIQLLLSDNGDIRFYNLIFDTSYDEFFTRVSELTADSVKLTEKERVAMLINVKVFIHSMIDLILVLLKYSDHLSLYDVKENIAAYLQKTPLDELASFIKIKK